MKLTSISLTYTDGAQLNLDMDGLTTALLRFLESLHGEGTPLIENATVIYLRCEICQGTGYDGGGFCSCLTGQNLQTADRHLARVRAFTEQLAQYQRKMQATEKER